ncbi:MAG: type II toxin-antitoxin system VapB family antitoxin [Synechococcaceae cyanobacterium]|nr:type II toxin-antitoxin system VapB family antitoxin [Synechococcaceae cyanobacterium]
MGMNIKDEEVHAMARRLAAERGTSVTDAVRQALRAELERSVHGAEGTAREARRLELLSLLEVFRGLTWTDKRSARELQADLYGADGLPG